MKFFIKDFFNKCEESEGILNGILHFFCAVKVLPLRRFFPPFLIALLIWIWFLIAIFIYGKWPQSTQGSIKPPVQISALSSGKTFYKHQGTNIGMAIYLKWFWWVLKKICYQEPPYSFRQSSDDWFPKLYLWRVPLLPSA